MKKYNLLALLLFVSTVCYSQTKRPSAPNDLPQNVINDFARAVNYSWNYANNTDAFKAALIPQMQRKGVYSPFEVERNIQNVGKSKSSRDLVLGALAGYTGMGRLNQILLNMNIPANSARILTSYAGAFQQQNARYLSQAEPTGNRFIVVSQKTYFYGSDAKGGVGQRRSAYLVEGEKITSLKQKDGYVYCDFTNPTTKISTKGWIATLDVEALNEDVTQVNEVDKNSPLYSLIKLDEGDPQKAYANTTITGLIKNIMQGEYPSFTRDFLSKPLFGDVYIRHNVLYLRSFIAHNADTHASFFIDLKTGRSFLYWNTFDNNLKGSFKVFGELPLSPSIINFINLFKVNMKDYMDDNDVIKLDQILNYHDPNEIFVLTDQKPEYPGGQERMYRFLSDRIKYPELAKKNNVTGKVIVNFVVEKNGDITNIHIERGLGSGCDEEVIRVMQASPRWKPGMLNNEPVRSYYIMNVSFILPEK